MDLRHLLTTKTSARLIYWLVWCYCRTLRLTVEHERCWQSHIAVGGRAIFAIWHQQFFPTVAYFNRFRQLRPNLIVSRSRDGEIAANYARLMGWQPVRGSSSRGGTAALLTMIRELRRGVLAGHIADGPRGPLGRVKPGLVEIAQAAGAAIVPVVFKPERAWLARSWDRFMIPQPFSQVRLCFGPLFLPPPTREREALESLRLRVEAAMRPYVLGLPPQAAQVDVP